MGAHNFTLLQEEFARFSDITSEPHENSEITQWVERLKEQGEKVIELIDEMYECRFYAPYQDIQNSFSDSVNGLQRSLRAVDIDFKLQTLER